MKHTYPIALLVAACAALALGYENAFFAMAIGSVFIYVIE